MSSKEVWRCPVCGCNAYERYGGYSEPAYKVSYRDGKEIREKIMWKSGRHFKCKGCSVFFSNPRLFNKEKIGSWQDGSF